MSRSLTAGTSGQLTQKQVYPIVLVDLTFKDGVLHFFTGYGSLSWNGNTYTGGGQMVHLGPIAEDTAVQAQGFEIKITGVPANLLSEGLNQCAQGNAVNVYFGFLDASANIITDPYLAFSGRMDVPTIEEGSDTATITITAENRLIDLDRPRLRTFTTADQITEFPTDTGFNFVPQLQELNLTWGKAQNIPLTVGGPGGGGGAFAGGGPGGNGRAALEQSA